MRASAPQVTVYIDAPIPRSIPNFLFKINRVRTVAPNEPTVITPSFPPSFDRLVAPPTKVQSFRFQTIWRRRRCRPPHPEIRPSASVHPQEDCISSANGRTKGGRKILEGAERVEFLRVLGMAEWTEARSCSSGNWRRRGMGGVDVTIASRAAADLSAGDIL